MLIVGIMWTKVLLTDPEHPVFVTLGDWHVSLYPSLRPASREYFLGTESRVSNMKEQTTPWQQGEGRHFVNCRLQQRRP